MICMNVEGELQSSCCITLELYIPKGVLKVFLSSSSGSIRTWKNASHKSICERYLAWAKRLSIVCWCGMGKMSRIVFVFLYRRSVTNLASFPPGLGTQKRFAAWNEEDCL